MRRAMANGFLIGLFGLGLLASLATRAGLLRDAWPRSGEPWFWVTSRAAGVTAFLALTADMLFGLLVSTGAADRLIRRATSVEVHRWLSGVALSLVGLHALSLLGDGTVRFDLLDALVPFTSGYRPAAVGPGVLAAYLALALHLSFRFRARLGAKAWRALHGLSFLCFALALGHGLLAGSDSSSPGMVGLHLLAGAAVGALAWRRLWPPAGHARG